MPDTNDYQKQCSAPWHQNSIFYRGENCGHNHREKSIIHYAESNAFKHVCWQRKIIQHCCSLRDNWTCCKNYDWASLWSVRRFDHPNFIRYVEVCAQPSWSVVHNLCHCVTVTLMSPLLQSIRKVSRRITSFFVKLRPGLSLSIRCSTATVEGKEWQPASYRKLCNAITNACLFSDHLSVWRKSTRFVSMSCKAYEHRLS